MFDWVLNATTGTFDKSLDKVTGGFHFFSNLVRCYLLNDKLHTKFGDNFLKLTSENSDTLSGIHFTWVNPQITGKIMYSCFLQAHLLFFYYYFGFKFIFTKISLPWEEKYSYKLTSFRNSFYFLHSAKIGAVF